MPSITEHVLEALESRVLLSADGLLAGAVGGGIQPDHLASQVIVETIHGEGSSGHLILQTAASAENSLIEVFGNAEDLTFGSGAGSATQVHETLSTGAAQQESVNEVLSVAMAKNDSLPKARFLSSDTLTAANREVTFSMTEEMVETLRTGNGPPQVAANKSLSLCSGFSSIRAEIFHFRGVDQVSSLAFSGFASIGLTSFGGVLLAFGLVQEPDKRESKILEPFVSSASRRNKKLSNEHSRKQALSGFRNLGIMDALAAKKSCTLPFHRFHNFFIIILTKCGHAFKSHSVKSEQRGLKFGSEWLLEKIRKRLIRMLILQLNLKGLRVLCLSRELKTMKTEICKFALFALFVVPVPALLGATTDEIRILDLRRSAAGSGLELVFASSKANYYEIWTAKDVAGEWNRAAMILGVDGEQTWSDPAAAGMDARYYRLVERSRNDPADADNDGLDDVFELTHSGMDPLARDRSTSLSISAASQSIAAGALPTAVHQTEVVVQVTPAWSYRLSVWLEGGGGYTGGGTASEGPAKLEGGDAVFVAGGGNASQQPMAVTTDANGRAVLRLTSSNQINEQCKVHAGLGTHAGFTGSDATSAPVTFELGTLEVELPPYLAREAFANATVKRSLNGVPVPGHETAIYVRGVRVNSREMTADWDHAGDLASYAAIEPGERRQLTDEDGQVVAPVYIRDVEGLGYVEVKAVDLQVFGK